jgi:hypothetical protein
MPVFRVIPNGDRGAFIVQGITGLAQSGATVHAWYNADGSVLDAELTYDHPRRASTTRPVQQHGPIWDVLESRAGHYRKMLDAPKGEPLTLGPVPRVWTDPLN